MRTASCDLKSFYGGLEAAYCGLRSGYWTYLFTSLHTADAANPSNENMSRSIHLKLHGCIGTPTHTHAAGVVQSEMLPVRREFVFPTCLWRRLAAPLNKNATQMGPREPHGTTEVLGFVPVRIEPDLFRSFPMFLPQLKFPK